MVIVMVLFKNDLGGLQNIMQQQRLQFQSISKFWFMGSANRDALLQKNEQPVKVVFPF
jgi:hypothetical protein